MKERLKKILPDEETLLSRFIVERIEARQEVLGLSHGKFAAALLVGLTRLKQTDIADALDLSYASLRTWASNDTNFKGVMNWGQGAFATIAAKRLREIFEEMRKEGGEVTVFLGRHPSHEFNDTSIYTKETLDRIAVVFFMHYTSAAALLGCPHKLFGQVARLVFGTHIWEAQRIVERRYLDQVNAFLGVNTKQFRPGGTPDPQMKLLVLLYIKGEQEYRRGEK